MNGAELGKRVFSLRNSRTLPLRNRALAGNRRHLPRPIVAFAKQSKYVDKSVIRYSSHITLSGMPPEIYDYIVNGKPALEWMMERYPITTDKDSGIRNDPNDWGDSPRYILDLLKRIVRVSVETVRIVKGLPALDEFKGYGQSKII